MIENERFKSSEYDAWNSCLTLYEFMDDEYTNFELYTNIKTVSDYVNECKRRSWLIAGDVAIEAIYNMIEGDE